jgi:hypothetical protein
MTQRDTVDGLIRCVLQAEVRSEEPSSAVRDSLFAAAAGENALRSTLGLAIPPLADGLQDPPDLPIDLSEQVMTVIPQARKQLLLLASPLCAVR